MQLLISNNFWLAENHFCMKRCINLIESFLTCDYFRYYLYHVMRYVSQIRMKQGCFPSKFDCHPDRGKRTCNNLERPYIIRKQRININEEYLNESFESSLICIEYLLLLHKIQLKC